MFQRRNTRGRKESAVAEEVKVKEEEEMVS